MTLAEMEQRLVALEQQVAALRTRVAPTPGQQYAWWHLDAGRFANDPVFDEIVRLGQEYRESLRPKERKKKNRSKNRNARP
jgi:hypothetical protein